MKKAFLIVFFTALLALGVQAKTIDQKREELKKIYEAGGISKFEYEKGKELLEKSKNKKSQKNEKKIFSLKKEPKKNINSLKLKQKAKKDEEEITLEKIDELGDIVKFDDSYYPSNMNKKFFRGCNNSFKCKGQKAGSFMWSNFGKNSTWGQKHPGKMIQSMAMYEIFYASRLYNTRKAIERFKEDKYKKGIFSKRKSDEDAIRSLFGMNNGRKNMREALGMDMDVPVKEAIQKFWLLGEFLEMGVPTDNNITVNKDIKDRQDRLDVYKATISTLKKKLKERAEEKKSIKGKS